MPSLLRRPPTAPFALALAITAALGSPAGYAAAQTPPTQVWIDAATHHNVNEPDLGGMGRFAQRLIDRNDSKPKYPTTEHPGGTGRYTQSRHNKSLRHDACEQASWFGSNRQANAEFTSARAHRKRKHTGDTDHRDGQSYRRESAKHDCIQTFRGQHFGSNIVQSRRAFNRLVIRHFPDNSCDLRNKRIRIGTGMDEQPPTANFLFERMVNRHRRFWIDALVVELTCGERGIAEARIESPEFAAARPGRVEHAAVIEDEPRAQAPGEFVALAVDRAVDGLAGRARGGCQGRRHD